MENDKNPYSILGSRLRSLRKQNNFTQEEIAKKLFISTTQFYKYESGRVKIPQANAERLAEIFGIDANYLTDENHTFPSEAYKNAVVIEKSQQESLFLNQAVIALLRLNGYEVAIADLSGTMQIAEYFAKLRKFFTIEKDGQTHTLSMEQVNTLGNAVNDVFTMLLKRYYNFED